MTLDHMALQFGGGFLVMAATFAVVSAVQEDSPLWFFWALLGLSVFLVLVAAVGGATLWVVGK